MGKIELPSLQHDSCHSRPQLDLTKQTISATKPIQIKPPEYKRYTRGHQHMQGQQHRGLNIQDKKVGV